MDFLTLVPGGTAADSSYLLSLTHYTCGGRKLCANGSVFPVKANLDFQAVGAPDFVQRDLLGRVADHNGRNGGGSTDEREGVRERDECRGCHCVV